MVLQLLVENGVKHGLANLKDGGTIKVETKPLGQELQMQVTNTGTLKIDKNSTQLGLKKY